MLGVPRYNNFERPDGWSAGDPVVLVSRKVQDDPQLGMPAVDYDGLGRLFHDDLAVPRDITPEVVLRPLPRWAVGVHTPFSARVTVDPSKAELINENRGGVMLAVAHEGKHVADGQSQKLLTSAELMARMAVLGIPIMSVEAVVDAMSLSPSWQIKALSPAVAVWVALRKLHYDHLDGAEARAYEFEDSTVSKRHFTDILFPHSERTQSALRADQISEEQLVRLAANGFVIPRWYIWRMIDRRLADRSGTLDA